MDLPERDNHSAESREPISSSVELRSWTTSRVIFTTLFVVSVFFTFWLIYRLRLLVLLYFLAVLIGTAIRPAVEWLHWRGIKRPVGVTVIYFSMAGILVGFLALVVPIIAEQITQFSQGASQYYLAFRDLLLNSGNHLLGNIARQMPSQLIFLFSNQPTTEEMFGQVARTFIYTNLVLQVIFSILAIFILAYHWTQERNNIIWTLLRLIPVSGKKAFREFLYSAEVKLGGYIRGQGILSLTVGLAAFIAYGLIGLPFTLVLAIIAGIMELVPVFGPALGAIPALLVALSVDPGKAIWVVAATGLIQVLENAWLVPRIMKNSLGVNPIIVLLSLVAFTSVFGFPGALIAIPAAGIIQLIVDRVVLSSNDFLEKPQLAGSPVQPMVDESQKLAQIMYDFSKEEVSLDGMSKPDREEINAIAQDVDHLIRNLKNEDAAV